MSILPRDDSGKIDYKSMWEYKLLKGTFKFLAYLIFFLYLATAIPSAWSWAKMKWIGGDFSMAALEENAREFIEDKESEDLVHLINLYPPNKTDDIVDTLTPYFGEMDTRSFFSFANKFYMNDEIEKAMKWYTYGRFRLRYDAVRCDYLVSEKIASEYVVLITNLELFDYALRLPPEELKPYITEALEIDLAHPPQNSPRYFCDFIKRYKQVQNVDILPEDDWEDRRKIMRFLAEEYVKSDVEEWNWSEDNVPDVEDITDPAEDAEPEEVLPEDVIPSDEDAMTPEGEFINEDDPENSED